MLKQKLSQKLLQKLSPQQIQLMKLLQVPTAALEQRIKEELEVNPALEENNFEDEDDPYGTLDEKEEVAEKEEEFDATEEIDLSDYLSDDDVAGYKLRDQNYSNNPDDDNKTIPIAVIDSFHEHLMQQLGMLTVDKRHRKIIKQIK